MDFSEIIVRNHPWLAPRTILVSPDIYKLFLQQLTTEGKDAAFLKALGIAVNGKESQ